MANLFNSEGSGSSGCCHADRFPVAGNYQRSLSWKGPELGLWLRSKALPLWIEEGYCAEEQRFVEALCEEDKLKIGQKNRARVQPRQIYVYTSAWIRGWRDFVPSKITSSYSWFLDHYLRPDDVFGNLVCENGHLVDPSFDLYNQAFALLMFAQMARFDPNQASIFEARAVKLLTNIKQKYRNANGGYLSGPAAGGLQEANPHMHLFEAALAWEEVAKEVYFWQRLSDEIGELALAHFIDSECGAVGEFFNSDWSPADGKKGKIIEPGHQFEWAWLLVRWGKKRGIKQALSAAEKMYEFGRTKGINTHGLSIMSVEKDGSILDSTARLWPQTEWLKAAIILALEGPSSKRSYFTREISLAYNALSRFLVDKNNGSWVDRIDSDGRVTDANAPASSFYHIVCAVYELEDSIQKLLAYENASAGAKISEVMEHDN